MAKIPYKISPRKVMPSIALVALLGVGAANLALDTVEEFEGYVPEGYLDPVGIPTRCWGDTTDVVVGKKYSFDECAKSINDHLYELAAPVVHCVRDFHNLPDKTKAALISMSYNIGGGAMCKSSVVRKLNAGDAEAACGRIAQIYKTARGKELPGLARRRDYESRMCLAGLRQPDDKGER